MPADAAIPSVASLWVLRKEDGETTARFVGDQTSPSGFASILEDNMQCLVSVIQAELASLRHAVREDVARQLARHEKHLVPSLTLQLSQMLRSHLEARPVDGASAEAPWAATGASCPVSLGSPMNSVADLACVISLTEHGAPDGSARVPKAVRDEARDLEAMKALYVEDAALGSSPAVRPVRGSRSGSLHSESGLAIGRHSLNLAARHEAREAASRSKPCLDLARQAARSPSLGSVEDAVLPSRRSSLPPPTVGIGSPLVPPRDVALAQLGTSSGGAPKPAVPAVEPVRRHGSRTSNRSSPLSQWPVRELTPTSAAPKPGASPPVNGRPAAPGTPALPTSDTAGSMRQALGRNEAEPSRRRASAGDQVEALSTAQREKSRSSSHSATSPFLGRERAETWPINESFGGPNVAPWTADLAAEQTRAEVRRCLADAMKGGMKPRHGSPDVVEPSTEPGQSLADVASDALWKFKVVHTHAFVREAPTANSRRIALLRRGRVISGHVVKGWLSLDSETMITLETTDADGASGWVKIDGGTPQGVLELVEPTEPETPEQEARRSRYGAFSRFGQGRGP